MRASIFATCALAVFAALPAGAASLSVEQLLSSYNAVTSGNLYSNQEIEGRMYVGGDLSGNTIQVGFVPLPPGPVQSVVVKGKSTIGKIAAPGEIVIGGNANTNIEKINGQPVTAYVGGTHSGTHNQITVNTGQAGQPSFEAKFPEIDFAAIASYSGYLATLSGANWTFGDINNKVIPALNNAVQSQGSNWIASKVTVLYTTVAALATGGFSFANLDADETIIINVAGTNGTWGLNGLGNAKTYAKNVLWNFYEATDLSINSAVIGSILAPNATLSGFSGSTEGSVIAKAINLTNGELHLQSLAGYLPDVPGQPELPPVPLPAGFPLLALGLGAIGLMRRKRA